MDDDGSAYNKSAFEKADDDACRESRKSSCKRKNEFFASRLTNLNLIVGPIRIAV